jgi:hypothetical protein
MRLIKAYLLRLYADTEVTERICGDIRPVDGKSSYPFKNANEFLILLRGLIGEPAHTTISESNAVAGEKEDH